MQQNEMKPRISMLLSGLANAGFESAVAGLSGNVFLKAINTIAHIIPHIIVKCKSGVVPVETKKLPNTAPVNPARLHKP